MPRNKAYNEQDVLEKAMNVFWHNGYERTSMRQLEQAMGINKFSIYASFGSKSELLQASLTCYAQKLNTLVENLQKAAGGAGAIRQYFYDFKAFSEENKRPKGCLITNTANEDIAENKQEIQQLIARYTGRVRHVFAQKLREDNKYTEAQVQQKADYLFIAMFGFSSALKVFSADQLDNYIDQLFLHV